MSFNQQWPRYRRLPAALLLASGGVVVTLVGALLNYVIDVPGFIVWPVVSIYASVEVGLAAWMIYAGRRFDPIRVEITSDGLALISQAGTRLDLEWGLILRVEGPRSSLSIPRFYVLWFRDKRGKTQTRGLLPDAAEAVRSELTRRGAGA